MPSSGAENAAAVVSRPPPPTSASVVPSSDPLADARALVDLFPSRYSRDDDGSGSSSGGAGPDDSTPVAAASSVTLVGGSTEGRHSDVILLVRCSPPVVPPADDGLGGAAFFPSAALVMDADEIYPAVARLDRKMEATEETAEAPGGAVLLSRSADDNGGSSTAPAPWFVLRLPGGAAVACTSPAALLLSEERERLAAAAAAPGKRSRAATGGDGDSGAPLPRVIEVDDAAAGVVPPPSYTFPSLSMNILSGGTVVPGFRPNSRVGIPVDTELFEGRILLIMKPPNSATDDPYWHEKVFSKKKRRFEVQIQGRFKYTPRGTVYCGAEVTEEMKLGLVSKGLCNMLLKLLTKMVPADMHFSFADNKANKKGRKNNGGEEEDEGGGEVPHIVFTAWSFFDRLVVTKPGENPPPMGEAFPESDKEAYKRKSSAGPGEWREGVTYSMSFNSMYLDLPTWHLRSLPVSRDLDLRTFWGDSLLRIVIYEKAGSPSESRHLTKDNRYLFAIETEFLGFSTDGGKKIKVEDRDSLPWDKAKPSMTRLDSMVELNSVAVGDDASSNPNERPSDVTDESEDYGEESDSDETAFYDAAETASLAEGGVESVVEADIVPASPENNVRKKPSSRAADNRSLSPEDTYCPGWVDMCAERGKYRKRYAFVVDGGLRIIFRSASEFAKSFSIERAKRDVEGTSSPRLSSSEKLRRIMGRTVATARDPSSKQHGRYRTFTQKQMAHDAKFLRRVTPSSNLSAKAKGRTVLSGFTARALSEHHWKEEWAILTERHVSFFHPENKKPSYRVHLSGIADVVEVPPAEAPNFPGCHVIAIETTGRRVYLMFFSEAERKKWLEGLSGGGASDVSAGGNARTEPSRLSSLSSIGGLSFDSVLALDDPAEEFLHKSTLFSCKQRRILNCSRFLFTGLNKVEEGRHPCDVVAKALRDALDPTGDDETTNLRTFLDSAANLKAVSVTHLSDAQKTAFFFNLYHVMVMHAYLVLGVPDSSFKWVSYFNMISYQCCDDIFSLTELEHCIIRGTMSSPTQFVAKFVLPKSRYSFALKSMVDWRVNFCLNCGSNSNPPSVPIFRPDSLVRQIDESTRLYSKHSVKVSYDARRGTATVTLPRVCQWYAADFGRGRNTDIVRYLMKYLSAEQREMVEKALSSDGRHFKSGALQVTYLPYDYKCKLLTLREG